MKKDRKAKLKRKLMRRRKNCAYCGAVLTKTNRSIDHVLPKSLFPMANSKNNLTLACRDCNSRKGAMVCIPDFRT